MLESNLKKRASTTSTRRIYVKTNWIRLGKLREKKKLEFQLVESSAYVMLLAYTSFNSFFFHLFCFMLCCDRTRSDVKQLKYFCFICSDFECYINTADMKIRSSRTFRAIIRNLKQCAGISVQTWYISIGNNIIPTIQLFFAEACHLQERTLKLYTGWYTPEQRRQTIRIEANWTFSWVFRSSEMYAIHSSSLFSYSLAPFYPHLPHSNFYALSRPLCFSPSIWAPSS